MAHHVDTTAQSVPQGKNVRVRQKRRRYLLHVIP